MSDMTHQVNWPLVIIYSDGACAPNPGPGGWAAILRFDSPSTGLIEKELKGSHPATTTSIRMELQAAIEGLKALKSPCQVELYTDSKYLYQGAVEWLSDWKSRGWRSRKGGKVKNIDLWLLLDQLSQVHEIKWFWIKGHANDSLNQRVDALARSQIPDPELPEDDKEAYHLYIRAACQEHQGGWGVVIRFGEKTKDLSGREANATANQMELRAAVEGLRAVSEGRCVHIYTTSDYVYSGMVHDIVQWQENGWITSTSKPVRYSELWQETLELQKHRHVEWHWLRDKLRSAESQHARQLALAEAHKPT
jgi:ribonuclease HI